MAPFRLLNWRRGLALAALVLGGLAAGLWLAPSNHYLFLPDEARPVAPLVTIANERADADGGIYMVDVLVRRASLLERLFPSVHGGASLVPAEVVNPVGVSERERRKSSQVEMTKSQQVAAAVALRALGYDVKATSIGALVSLVVPDAPAAGRLEPGDVIVQANDREVRSPGDLRRALQSVTPGAQVTIAVRRAGKLEDLTLGTRADPDRPGRAVVGVIVEQAATIDLPVEITINAGSIGGPSAGLAFALDIVDELGRDIDDGRRIAVTGALDLNGEVAGVGGVKQKTIGARRAGADVLLVPRENAAEARRYAEDLEVVPVKTFTEALQALSADPLTN